MKWVSRSLAIAICAMVAIAFLATPAVADDEKDPPGRVARLKYMSGQVSFQPGGVNDWVDATMNRPLTTADRVWTDKESKAELHLGSAAIRMASETSVTLTNLDDNTVQVQLDQGVLNLHVRKMYPGEVYEIDTPNVAFTLLKPGDYRFEVDPDRDTTEVIVRKGKGEGNGDGRGVQVESGEMAVFEHGNTLMHAIQRAPGFDSFDDWCRVRNEREARGYESARYVSDDVIGYEDLDEYGYWRPAPTYGYIWVPRHVVVGWAPYRYGHWAYVGPWGWTWIDDAPWGFAPFHYGRWVYSSWGWGWCPGPRHYRPVYAPALVAWIGGGGWGVGFGVGNVGWVPLGWGEPYYPYYRASHGYVRNVNITNTHITNITYVTNNYTNIINNHGKPVRHGYMNARGVSVVPGDAMVRSEHVNKVVQPWKGKDLRDVEVHRAPGVTPDRQTVLGGGREARRPERLHERPVVTKMTPPERPASFESRRPYIEKNNGIPSDRNTDARGPRGSEERKPVMTGEGPKGPREGNRENSAGPVAPRAPAERKPADDVNEAAANADNGRRSVPRPPMERKPAAGADNDSTAGRGTANNESPRRAVPRPPADRQPIIDVTRKAEDSPKQRPTPQAPAERRPVTVGDESVRPTRPTLPERSTKPDATEERKPATPSDDAARSTRATPPERNARPNAPEERRQTDAEARPQSAPRTPDREVRPPQERSAPPSREARQPAERKSAPPAREEKSKPADREGKPAKDTPAGGVARSGPSHYVPRPPYAAVASNSFAGGRESLDSRRSSFREPSQREAVSRDSYRPREYTVRDTYRARQADREYSRPSYAARDYGYRSQSSSRNSGYGGYSGYSRRGYLGGGYSGGGRSEMRSAPSYRSYSGYSGRSSGSGYSQPSHAASGYSGRSGGGSASSNRGGGHSGWRSR